MKTIDPDRVHAITKDLLISNEEHKTLTKAAEDAGLPLDESFLKDNGFVGTKGIMHYIFFGKGVIDKYKKEIAEMLMLLPHQFRATVGGGYSFLSAPLTENGELWGSQRDAETLCILGEAAGLGEFVLREFQSSLPGSVPYYAVFDTVCQEVIDA